MVWDSRWEMDNDKYLLDADTLARDLVYDVVILGSAQVLMVQGGTLYITICRGGPLQLVTMRGMIMCRCFVILSCSLCLFKVLFILYV